jgi:rhodanese-related sulfurtransferase
MTLQTISPLEAKGLVAKGALLIDIREPDEFARARILGAVNAPLSRLAGRPPIGGKGRVIVFHCKSGARTMANLHQLAEQAPHGFHVMEGGLAAWQANGFSVVVDRRQPLEMNRQVQIVAGSLALAGAVLGAALHPAFYALSGAIGAGLVYSGVSGTCAMVHLLKRMPWNRPLPA